MKKNILLFISLFLTLGLSAQGLEVSFFGNVVRTKDFVNLIFNGDTTVRVDNSEKLAHLKKDTIESSEKRYFFENKREVWIVNNLEKILKKNKEVKAYMEKFRRGDDIVVSFYFDREGKIMAVRFLFTPGVCFDETMRKPLQEMQKQWLAEKVNFAEYWDFTGDYRYAETTFRLAYFYRGIMLYRKLE